MYVHVSKDDCQLAVDLIDELDSSCFSVVEHNGEWSLSCDDDDNVIEMFTSQELRALLVKAVAYDELTSMGVVRRLEAADVCARK